ncbi:unnamed protein product [Brachionus calyciflorus]|uniref:Uncharacterized protein n=1 Tax=Brachionus calyciflorus TaxID=104777 RepID=A0A813M7I3_9BILA|nr:unnamed protein product [Brachionus calyciflorus]
MFLTTRKPEIQMLSQQLQTINTQLTMSLGLEMQRLKEQEKELQEALKLKTRTELIRAMENELDMDVLNENFLSSKSLTSLNNSQNNYTYTSEFLKSLNLDDDLRKSHQILDNLLKEYTNSSYLNSQNLRTLQNTARPNVIFTKSSKYTKKPLNLRTITIYKPAPTLDLNKQQTLNYANDGKYLSKSMLDLSRSNNFADNSLFNQRDYAKSIRDRHFYSGQENINGIKKSRIRETSTHMNKDPGYTTLPLSKTLVHKKPWSYGKVETNYYTFRDQTLRTRKL